MILREFLVLLYKSPPHSNRDTCIITGATHGIGYDIAKVFARDGFNLILVARYEEELETAKQQLLKINSDLRIFTIAKDLYAENAADDVFYEAKAIEGTNNVQINYLVNNVGVFLRGDFLELPLVDQLGMIHLNIFTTTKLTHYFGNEFKKQIDRHPNDHTTFKILFTSSSVSLIACPFMSVYSATKAFVHSFSLCLNEELRASKYQGKITCTSLCPGYTVTPAFIPNGIYDTVALALKNYDYPPRVARNGYYALMNKEPYILVGFFSNFTYWISSILFPINWGLKLSKFFNADWESLSFASIKGSDFAPKHSWNKNSQASRDLREGFAKQ